jgi:ABC-2 type transport system permease protein
MLQASDEQSEVAGVLFFVAIGGVFWVAMSIYSVWYLLDCLYADRKDRSVLFFKSLPLTDSATVLSKLFVGVIAIPLVYFCAADIAALLVAFVISVRARLVFGNVLWRPEVWLQVQTLWLYVIATGILWYLPIVGWLLLVSAWAKRAVILQAILPPLAIMLAEHLFLRTHAASLLFRDRLLGGSYVAFHHPIHWSLAKGEMTPGVWQLPDPVGFLSSADVWIGVALGAAFITGAVQLRKRRTDA